MLQGYEIIEENGEGLTRGKKGTRVAELNATRRSDLGKSSQERRGRNRVAKKKKNARRDGIAAVLVKRADLRRWKGTGTVAYVGL